MQPGSDHLAGHQGIRPFLLGIMCLNNVNEKWYLYFSNTLRESDCKRSHETRIVISCDFMASLNIRIVRKELSKLRQTWRSTGSRSLAAPGWINAATLWARFAYHHILNTVKHFWKATWVLWVRSEYNWCFSEQDDDWWLPQIGRRRAHEGHRVEGREDRWEHVYVECGLHEDWSELWFVLETVETVHWYKNVTTTYIKIVWTAWKLCTDCPKIGISDNIPQTISDRLFCGIWFTAYISSIWKHRLSVREGVNEDQNNTK